MSKYNIAMILTINNNKIVIKENDRKQFGYNGEYNEIANILDMKKSDYLLIIGNYYGTSESPELYSYEGIFGK